MRIALDRNRLADGQCGRHQIVAQYPAHLLDDVLWYGDILPKRRYRHCQLVAFDDRLEPEIGEHPFDIGRRERDPE